MGRSRKIGIVGAAIASVALVAGCGASGGYTASEAAPTGGQAPATGTTTTGADGGGTAAVVGAYPPADPGAAISQYSGYGQFPKERAGTVFTDPTVKPAPAAPATPVTTIPTAPTTSPAPTTPTTTPTTPAPTPVTTVLTASLDVSGAVQVAKVGDSVPKDSPQFTVQAITTSKVTLKLISGTLPGGGTTVDIAVGEAVTLSNPTTGASYVVKVVEIKQEV